MDEETPIKMIYAEWKKSGKTQREFCDEKGLRMSWLKYHFLEGRKSGVLTESRRRDNKAVDGEMAFAPVQIKEAEKKESPAYCEILFFGEVGIRIETQESMASLKVLMSLLMPK